MRLGTRAQFTYTRVMLFRTVNWWEENESEMISTKSEHSIGNVSLQEVCLIVRGNSTDDR